MGKITGKLLIKNAALLLFILLFISAFSKVFGGENTLVGVALITAVLMFHKVHLSLPLGEASASVVVTWFLMSFATYTGWLSPYLQLFVNLAAIFPMIYLYTYRLETKAYLPFLLCYVFAEGSPIPAELLPRRVAALTAGGFLIAASYFLSHRKNDRLVHHSLRELVKSFSAKQLRFNFALRVSVGISLAMLLGGLFSLEKGMWISVTALSLIQPHKNQTHARIRKRILGTLAGVLLFFLIFHLILPAELAPLVMALLGYIYMFVSEYHLQIVFITLNALGAAMILYDPTTSIAMRVIFVLAGALIAFAVNLIFYRSDFDPAED